MFSPPKPTPNCLSGHPIALAVPSDSAAAAAAAVAATVNNNKLGERNKMLYGGPLGTYLSGLSSSTSSTSPSVNPNYYTSPHNTTYTGSGYLNSGLRRSNSRYRPSGTSNLSVNSNTSTANSTGGTGNYYTPQTRRKYDSDSVKSVNRYGTRPTKSSVSPISSTGLTSSSPSAAAPSTTSFHFSRWSPNKSPTTPVYGKTGLGSSASWNSDLCSVANNTTIDYKRLYETEKVATEELRNEISQAHKEMIDLKAQIDAALQTRRISGAEKRLLDKLRAESEKLKAEHRALVRVVSRLNREQ